MVGAEATAAGGTVAVPPLGLLMPGSEATKGSLAAMELPWGKPRVATDNATRERGGGALLAVQLGSLFGLLRMLGFLFGFFGFTGPSDFPEFSFSCCWEAVELEAEWKVAELRELIDFFECSVGLLAVVLCLAGVGEAGLPSAALDDCSSPESVLSLECFGAMNSFAVVFALEGDLRGAAALPLSCTAVKPFNHAKAQGSSYSPA